MRNKTITPIAGFPVLAVIAHIISYNLTHLVLNRVNSLAIMGQPYFVVAGFSPGPGL
jgi:hypothetical protein